MHEPKFLSATYNYRVLDDPDTPIHTLRPPSASLNMPKKLKKNRSFDRESVGFQASDEGDDSRDDRSDSIDESPVIFQKEGWDLQIERSRRILSTTWIKDDTSPQIYKGANLIKDDDLESQTTMKSSVKFVNGLPTVVTKDKPHKFYCIVCHYEGQTKMSYVMSKSLIMLSIVFLFTLFWPCLFYAMFSNRWKDIVHYCPKCNHVVGKRKMEM